MRVLLIGAAAIIALAGCQKGSTASTNSKLESEPGAVAADASAKGEQYVIDRVYLPGNGRGDYITVDLEARRLYVTHTKVVHILDLDTLAPLSEVTGLVKAHGVALDQARKHGFASDGGANDVVMFDLATGETLKRIATGENPDSILMDPASGMIFSFNGTTQDASVIDPSTGTVVKTIPLGDKPEFSRADGKGKIWVNLERSATIAEIDSSAMEVVNRWKLPDCGEAAALAFDAVNRRLFSSCGEKVLKVVDADSGAIIAELPIGEDADGAEYDPANHRIYVTNRNGTMTIIKQNDKDSYEVEQNLKTEEYAKTIAVDPKTHRIFSTTADLVWPEAQPGYKRLPNAKFGTFRLLAISEKE